MGLEESKVTTSNKGTSNKINICVYAPLVSGNVVHHCSLYLWRQAHRGHFNFQDKSMKCIHQFPNECTPSFCLSRQNIINCHKTRQVFLRNRKKGTKVAEHFEYNHIPAHLSSIQNLHFKSVLDILSGVAVVHLARGMITQFAIVNLRINKFLGSFGRQTVEFNPETTIGRISPDGTYCLMRLPWLKNRRRFILKLYNVRNCELMTELPLVNKTIYQNNDDTDLDGGQLNEAITQTVNQSPQVLFVFDPRFLNSRIAITNVHFHPHYHHHNCRNDNNNNNNNNNRGSVQSTLSLVKLPTWECLLTTNQLYPGPTGNTTTNTTDITVNNSNNNNNNNRNNRRRCPLDVNHMTPSTSGTVFTPTSPHILSLFYSKDGFLLFTVTTDSYACRCTATASADNTHLNQCFHSELQQFSNDLLHKLYHSSNRNCHSLIMNGYPQFVLQSKERRSRRVSTKRTKCTPTLPGCVTLWLSIFNSDTLERLCVLRYDRAICPLHTCPTNYLPLMSRCGSRIALIVRQAVSTTQLLMGPYSNADANLYSKNSLVPFTLPRLLAALNDNHTLLTNSLRHSVPACNSRISNNTSPASRELTKIKDGIGGSDAQLLHMNEKLIVLRSDQSYGQQSSHQRYNISTENYQKRIDLPMDFPAHRQMQSTFGLCNKNLLCPINHNTVVSSSYDNSEHCSPNSIIQLDVVFVYQLPPPPKLQALVRQKIRQLCKSELLDQLNLPPSIISYLRFQPCYNCAGSCIISRSNSSTQTIRSDSFDAG